jgi:hypothetical protein
MAIVIDKRCGFARVYYHAPAREQLGFVWPLSFGARIKVFICDFMNYLFGYHGIDYGIYLDFYDFQPMLNLISF